MTLSRIFCRVFPVFAIIATTTSLSEAQECLSAGAEPFYSISSGRRCSGALFPPDNLYPPYLADPHRPAFGIQRNWHLRTEIPESTSQRMGVKLGGVFGLFRWITTGSPDLPWQVGAVGAFNGTFDAGSSLDNIGWNGEYGMEVSHVLGGQWSTRFGYFHRSSHLGDEYQEKTGRARVGYTREEMRGGISWGDDGGLRVYGDAGWGFHLGNNSLMKPWRLQTGVEYRSLPVLPRQHIGWYAAMDATSMQERDWRPDISLQAGIFLSKGGRLWRFGLEHYHGKPLISEFLNGTEQYVSVGLWLDWDSVK